MKVIVNPLLEINADKTAYKAGNMVKTKIKAIMEVKIILFTILNFNIYEKIRKVKQK
jgi:uncharacterized protein YfaS (alpha-2-macroglobulin family)